MSTLQMYCDLGNNIHFKQVDGRCSLPAVLKVEGGPGEPGHVALLTAPGPRKEVFSQAQL